MNNTPVTVTIKCRIKLEALDAAWRELKAVTAVVMEREPACGGIRVHEDPKDPQRWLIIEQWESEEIFSGPHLQTPHMQSFLKKAESFLEDAAEFEFWRETLVR